MKRILLSCLMLLVMGAAATADEVISYEPGNEFTSVSEGDIFAIYNPEEGKYLYGAGDQNLGYDGPEKAFLSGNTGWLFKVEPGDVDGHYLLHLQTPGGEDYSIWGSPGYLNSQPVDGWCSFILGLNHNEVMVWGQDGENLALWEIEDVGYGFKLKNVGTGLYLNNAAPAKFSEDEAVVWTFCELVESSMENPIPEAPYDAIDAKTDCFEDIVTIDEDATWDADTRTFTKRCGFVWDEGIDLSSYRYIVITAAQSRENAGAGNIRLKDSSGMVVQGDDYKGGPYALWLSLWNAINSCVIDLENLRSQKMFDIYSITELSIDGGDKFILGNVYATNFETATTGRWANKDEEGNHRFTGLAAGQFGTVCLPYQAASSGAFIYEVAGKDSEAVYLRQVTGLMEAGKPYIYCALEGFANNEGVYPENRVYFYQTTDETVVQPLANNGLIGTFEDSEVPAGNNALLANNLFASMNGTAVLPANTAYLNKSAVSGGATSIKINFGQVTGISSTKVAEALNSGKMYDLQGREVVRPARGVYMVNGKKLVIR